MVKIKFRDFKRDLRPVKIVKDWLEFNAKSVVVTKCGGTQRWVFDFPNIDCSVKLSNIKCPATQKLIV